MVILGPSSLDTFWGRGRISGGTFLYEQRKVWGQNSSCGHYGSQWTWFPRHVWAGEGGLVWNCSGEPGWGPVSVSRDAIAPGRVDTMVWSEWCQKVILHPTCDIDGRKTWGWYECGQLLKWQWFAILLTTLERTWSSDATRVPLLHPHCNH